MTNASSSTLGGSETDMLDYEDRRSYQPNHLFCGIFSVADWFNTFVYHRWGSFCTLEVTQVVSLRESETGVRRPALLSAEGNRLSPSDCTKQIMHSHSTINQSKEWSIKTPESSTSYRLNQRRTEPTGIKCEADDVFLIDQQM